MVKMLMVAILKPDIPPSENLIVVPGIVKEYLDTFSSLSDTPRYAVMYQDEGNFYFINARDGGRHDTAIRWRKKRWLLIDGDGVSFLELSKM